MSVWNFNIINIYFFIKPFYLLYLVIISWLNINFFFVEIFCEKEKNKWPNRYPDPDKVAGIFPDHPLALNLVHYNTKTPEYLFDEMVAVTQIAGPNFHGFQLNIAWPDPEALKRYRNYFHKVKIVLQVGQRAFLSVAESPEKLALKVKSEYTGLVDYVLLDPSGGLGKFFDPIYIAPYF